MLGSLYLLAIAGFDFCAAAPVLDKRAPAGVPRYVLDYAPLVYLSASDPYRPSDIAAHLSHTTPQNNFVTVAGAPNPLTLNNLNNLNNLGGANVYLTSKDDITKNPAWLKGVTPDSTGKTNGAFTAAIIVNDKGSGNVDAFYMYFYSYNKGNVVFGKELGDHVGDWEHTMVRFKNGVPQWVWYSQHSNGEAFAYAILQKQGKRPLAYSASGSHATYAIPGTHDHTIPNLNLPNGLIVDNTDAGILWDPLLSAYYYKYAAASNTFTAYDSSTPTAYLNYVGKWGDQQYPNSDPRQDSLLGIEYKFVSGPTGPQDKQLNRTEVCPDNGNPCIYRIILGP